MPYSTLIDPPTLAARLDDPDWTVADCRFSLNDTERGRKDYLTAHIPGAVYGHLDDDLSGPVVAGRTGRHPLPTVTDFAEWLESRGIGDGVQVVVYDDAGGAIAARLWWMLRWLGHDAVAVLDGGWPRWVTEDRPIRSGEEHRPRRSFEPRPRSEWIVEAGGVEELRRRPEYRLLDAREAERYRGEKEPIDPIAGHIPGALSAPFRENLAEEGTFRAPEELRLRFEDLLEGRAADLAVTYCGSGVTAAHNALAMAHAGLGIPRLYPGSWSEWIALGGEVATENDRTPNEREVE